jgi:hypothetical protein
VIETIEFRVDYDNAHLVFTPDEGTLLGRDTLSPTRKIEVSSADPRLAKMAEIQRVLRSKHAWLYYGWIIHHRYSPEELEAAELLRLIPTCFFEPEGEDCGTVYDESTACPICHAGRLQVSDLELNVRKIPKRADIAISIASEWVFSRRLAEAVEREGLSGIELRPVVGRARGTRQLSPDWVQPVVTSAPVDVAPATRFGIDPLNDDPSGEYRCPLGHIAGLNILSELSLVRGSWDKADFAITRQFVGAREGVLVPFPLVLISQQFYQLLKREKMRGFKAEVAHLE